MSEEIVGNYRARRFHAHKVGADRLMAAYGPSLPFVALQRDVGNAGMSRPNADFAVADALAAAA
jgi:hypothetical protein